MAAGNDTVNIKVKYIPDTSALKNIKEIKTPEIKVGGKDAGKGIFDSYNNAIRNLNKELSKGTDASAITKAFKTVGEETQKVKTQINSMKEAISQSFQSPSNQSLIKDYQNLEKQLKKLEVESQKRRKKSAELSSFKSQNNMSTPQARKEISKAEALVTAGEKLTKQDQERLEIAKQIVAKEEELAKLRTQEEIRSAQKEVKTKMASPEFESMMPSGETNQQLNWLSGAMSTVTTNANLSTTELKKFKEVESEVVKQTKEAKDQVVKFGDIISGTFLGTSLSNLFQTGLSRGIEFFKDYDEVLTRTMMVTGQTREEVNSLTSSYNKLANQLSSTTKDVAAAQLVFYQQGLGTSDALKMTEASIAVSKTGGIDAAEAADRLTAAVRGYQLSANEAMDIADKMSALDAAAASSVDELTIAMQKSASQARMAGLDLDYYMAYLSTMQEVTREAPENIGTAMKSITSRLQEIKDIGKIEEDGTTFSNVAKALTSIGIAATDSSGQLRTLQDIMNELGPMWNTLDRNHKAYIATVLAGNRQQSRFIALMDNYDRAMELVDVSQNASGESAKQLRAYNQGLEASFTRLNNAWQQFATNIADSTVIKKIIDLFSTFVETLNKIPKGITSTVVPLLALTKVFTTLSKAGNLFKGFKKWSLEKMGLDIKDEIGALNKILEHSPNSIKKFYNAFKEGNKVIQDNVKTIKTSSDTIKENNIALGANATAHESLNAEVVKESTSMSSNDRIKLSEREENAAIATSQNNLENATEAVNAELERQNQLFGTNSTPKAQKITSDLTETTNQLAMLRNQKQQAISSQEALKGQMQERLSKARSDYESRSDIYLRQVRAKEKLGIGGNLQLIGAENKKDLFEAYEAKAFTAKGNPRRTTEGKQAAEMLKQLKKDYHEIGVEYNKTQKEIKAEYFDPEDRYSGKLGEGNKEIEDIDKQIKKLQRKKKKLQKELTAIPTPKDEPDTTKGFFGTLKDIGSDKNLTGIEKLGKSFGALSESVGGFSGVLSNVALGSMVAMGAETVGLDKDLSGALGTFTGLGKTLGSIHPAGWLVAAAVAGLGLAYKKAFPSIEAVEEKLEEIRLEQDELKQKESDFSSALDVYTELSNKLDLTEEEQEQLTSSTETLAKALPEAVQGYDEYGNAIINAGQAMEYLNELQEQQRANSAKMLDEFDELQRAQVSGWEKIGQWLLKAGSFTSGSPILYGLSTAWEESISRREMEGNRKVIEENYQEIYDSLLDSVAEITDKGAEKYKSQRESITSLLVNSMLSTGKDYGKDIDEIKEEISGLFGSFTENTLDNIARATERAKTRMDFTNLSWDDIKKQLTKSLTDYFAGLDLSDEEFDLILKASLNIVYEGKVNIDEVKEKIRESIINSKDQDFIDAAQLLYSEIGAWDPRLQKIIQDLGLLDARFAELYQTIGGMEGLKSLFVDKNKMLDEETGKVKLANELLKEMDQENVEKEALEKEKDSVQKEIEEKKKKIEELQKEINLRYRALANNEENGPSGSGYYSNRKMEIEQDIKIINSEIDKLEDNIVDLDGKIKTSSDTVGKLESTWDTLLATIEMGVVPTFTEISNVIKDCQEDFEAFFSLADTLDSTGGILNADALTQIFDLLGSFEDVAFDTQEQYNAWMHAIEAVNDGLVDENGVLRMNASAMQGINDLISYSSRLKFEEMKASIEKSKMDLENQRTVLIAQRDMLDEKIAYIENMKEEEYKNAQASGDLQKNLSEAYVKLLDAQNIAQIKGEQDKLTTLFQLEQNYYKQLALLRDAYRKGENVGDVKFVDLKGEYSRVYESFKKESSEAFTGLITEDKKETVDNLKKYRNSLNDQITQLNGRIDEEIKLKETVTSYLANSNTNLAGTFSDATNEASDYNEVLERTLTLLEKIEGLQHKIDENETFKDLYKDYSGEDYGRLMMTNLDLAQQQYDVYKDLFKMQQEMTNQAAGDLLDSPYGQMFKIQENGDIGWADLTMYDKYKNMPADMKEDIDNLVEAFQKQRDALRDTEKNMSKYAQEVKKVREELVQMQIEIENELVDAIKNREKILHDARVKALDDEIDMIEKAVEARKKAQEDDNSNKELYKAQEALRRATLDSSGKNNAQLLQLQQDLEDKQLEIAEKRFEDDMDDRKQWLQDTKDAETETYDYRLEKMTWYWEQVQAIQEEGTEAMMETLIHWNKEYAQTSEYQQSEMERKWKETMDAMKAATDMGAELGKLTSDIISVTQTVEAMDIKIQALPGSWQKATDAANAYSAAARQASSYSPGTSNFVSDNKETEQIQNGNGGEKADTSYQKWVGKEVEVKGSGTYTGYDKDGQKTTYKKSHGTNENVIIQKIKKFEDGKYYAYGKPESGKNKEYHWIPVDDLQTTDFFGKKLTKNAKGGLVDYTGPTWVDGTFAHPEAFLSAYQTEQIGALAQALDPSTVNNATTNSNVTFGSINFNVASMSSAADGKKALDIFVQGANDMMAKKGIGTKLNINMK